VPNTLKKHILLLRPKGHHTGRPKGAGYPEPSRPQETSAKKSNVIKKASILKLYELLIKIIKNISNYLAGRV
jgi:hypothetical protein